MSDAKNLNDFFAQESKKKKNKKGGNAKPAKPAADTRDEETKKEPVAAQPEPQTTPAQDFADSSDEESNTIVINEGRKKIIDRKDLEASKKNKDDDKADSAAGWGLGTKIGQVEEDTTSKPMAAAAAKGPGGIKFGKGPPTFTRKAKGIMDNQDFPDLDAAADKGSAAQEQTKANSAMMYNFGSAAKGSKESQPAEEKKAATKPVFKGKAKLNTGAPTEEVGGMSYDFSKMRMSAATTGKKPAGEGQGSKPEGEKRARQPASFGDDDDFEVVADKKKARRNFEEPKFGGGMPSFTRGGAK